MPLFVIGGAIVAAGLLIARSLGGKAEGSSGSGPHVDPDPRAPKDKDGSGGAGGAGSGTDAPINRDGGTGGNGTQTTVHGVTGNYNEAPSLAGSFDLSAPPAGQTPSQNFAAQPVVTLPGGYTTNYNATQTQSIPAAAITPGARGRILE